MRTAFPSAEQAAVFKTAACSTLRGEILQPYTPVAVVKFAAAMTQFPLRFQRSERVPHTDYDFRFDVQRMVCGKHFLYRQRRKFFQGSKGTLV